MSERSSKNLPVQGTAYYRPQLGRAAFAPRHWGKWLAVAVLWASAWLPLVVARSLGAALGLLMMAANRKRREIARTNLALCFPQLDAAQRGRLLRRHFIVSGQAYVDLGLLIWGAPQRVLRVTRMRGLEHYRESISRGRPVILLAPHMVGMNFGGAVLSREHATFSMMKLQRDPWADWVLNKGRMRFGAQLLSRDQGLRPVLRGLRQGLAFYYLPDEDFGPRESVFAPFFGAPRATLPTLGRLARLSDAVVIPCFTRVLPGGRGYEVILHPPLHPFPHGDPEQDAAHVNRAIEDGLRDMPEQYMWTFKMFKTRPAGEADAYS